MQGEGARRLHLGAPVALEGEEGEGAGHGEGEQPGQGADGHHRRGPGPPAHRARQQQHRPHLQQRREARQRPHQTGAPGTREQRGDRDGRHHDVVAGVDGGAEQWETRHPHPGAARGPAGAQARVQQQHEDGEVGEEGQDEEGRRVVEEGQQTGGEDREGGGGRVLPGDVGRRERTGAQDLVPALVDDGDVGRDVRAGEEGHLEDEEQQSEPGHAPGRQQTRQGPRRVRCLHRWPSVPVRSLVRLRLRGFVGHMISRRAVSRRPARL